MSKFDHFQNNKMSKNKDEFSIYNDFMLRGKSDSFIFHLFFLPFF